MTKVYGRSRESVISWPVEVTAREVLARYLDRLSVEPATELSEYSLLAADGIDFSGADLSGLELQEAAFNEANLRNIRAVDADMYREWLMSANISFADLTRSDLRKVEGRGCDAANAVLHAADMQGAVFEDAFFRRADLHEANLRDASFVGADLRDADLRACQFGWTDFSGCRFSGSIVAGAKGMVLGPIDVGVEAPCILNGDELRSWFAANGAPEVEVYQAT